MKGASQGQFTFEELSPMMHHDDATLLLPLALRNLAAFLTKTT
jgi:hypothetical protein